MSSAGSIPCRGRTALPRSCAWSKWRQGMARPARPPAGGRRRRARTLARRGIGPGSWVGNRIVATTAAGNVGALVVMRFSRARLTVERVIRLDRAAPLPPGYGPFFSVPIFLEGTGRRVALAVSMPPRRWLRFPGFLECDLSAARCVRGRPLPERELDGARLRPEPSASASMSAAAKADRISDASELREANQFPSAHDPAARSRPRGERRTRTPAAPRSDGRPSLTSHFSARRDARPAARGALARSGSERHAGNGSGNAQARRAGF